MVFSSLLFLCAFLPLCLALYYLTPGVTGKNLVLTILSLVFYAFGEPVWVLLLVLCTAIHYLNGRIVQRYAGRPAATVSFWVTVAISLGLLCAFKYLNFLIGNLNLLLGLSIPASGLGLPLGISFYTFQTLAYAIDVHKGRTAAQRSFLEFLLFVSLFPQLTAGPILRHGDLAPQLRQRKTTAEGFSRGAVRFTCGLAKKVLLADHCSLAVTRLFVEQPLGNLQLAGAWLGILMYAFQLYFDFSGYSDMAIGLGRMFGFEFAENFDHPYISRSISEFWRRWHITLGAWFRDYIYFPLGGSRRGLGRQLLNMLAVWLLTGLWHGAGWNYVLWGLWFFLLLAAEKLLGKARLERIPGLLSIPLTFLLVLLGRVLFYFESAGDSLTVFRAMLGLNGLWDPAARLLLIQNLPLLAVCILGSTPLPLRLATRWQASVRDTRHGPALTALPAAAYICVLLALCLVSLAGASNSPFIYFRF